MATRQGSDAGKKPASQPAAAPPAEKSALPRDLLRVKVWSPFHVYFDGTARSVSGVNGTGPFDVLPRHRNFITLLSPCNLALAAKEGEVKIRISGGVMQVHHDTVTVYLEA
jgi:F-type H+-transporting ATPase subunit epsilon